MTPFAGVTRFVLFFPGRTGSTYLIEALDSHPEIQAGLELMPRPKQDGLDRRFLESERPKWAIRQHQWVKKYMCHLQEYGFESNAVIGFKTKLRDVADPERMADLLRELSVRVITMTRHNSVKLTVSLINGERLWRATGSWHLYSNRDRPAKSFIDPALFQECLKIADEQQAAIEEYVAKLNLPNFAIDYEDLLLRRQATLDRVCTFLGVRPQPMQGRALKATSDDLREAVTNFDELRALYSGTQHEAMFDEVLLHTELPGPEKPV